MKKLIIASYFVVMSLVTYATAKVIAVYKSDSVEVKFREHETELTDTEMAQAGIIPREDKHVVQKWKTMETRTKTLFGWETKVDVIEQPSTWYINNHN